MYNNEIIRNNDSFTIVSKLPLLHTSSFKHENSFVNSTSYITFNKSLKISTKVDKDFAGISNIQKDIVLKPRELKDVMFKNKLVYNRTHFLFIIGALFNYFSFLIIKYRFATTITDKAAVLGFLIGSIMCLALMSKKFFTLPLLCLTRFNGKDIILPLNKNYRKEYNSELKDFINRLDSWKTYESR